MDKPVHFTLLLLGLGGLLLGGLLYVTDRPPGDTYFISALPAHISLFRKIPALFGGLGASLPAFLHVFSFSLLTAGFLSVSGRICAAICGFWLLVDAAFEFGQKFPEVAVRLIPDWFDRVPFLENCADYFQRGTFDPFDLTAMAAGAAAAWSLMIWMKRKQEGNA